LFAAADAAVTSGSTVSDFDVGVLVVIGVTLRAVGLPALAVCSMPHRVTLILRRCIPTKVLDPSVGPVAIVMAALHAVRAWPDERGQCDAVD